MSFRNLCIIAHVDHGKTTLVDHLLRQAGSFKSHESLDDRVMDSMDLEKERGITIQAKNAAIRLDQVKVNLVDTPGHADFGGEVERILSMVDSALLLVDAAEGPLPQTRFVLQKALERNFKPIVVVNKVDRPECRDGRRVKEVINQIFDLFVELGATDEQANFPMLYACAKEGWCCSSWEEAESLIEDPRSGSLRPLFQLILEKVPPPEVSSATAFQMMVSNLGYSDFVGELAIGRVYSGSLQLNDRIFRQGQEQSESFQVIRLYTYDGLRQVEVRSLEAGDIGIVSGCKNFEIGDTLTSDESLEPLQRIRVESPSVGMIFAVNTSAFAGLEGKPLLSRALGERLHREAKKNVALRVEATENPDQFRVLGRGELQFAILIEQMRREGFEFSVGKPLVLFRGEGDQREEPLERVVIDLPQDYASEVTALYQERRGILQSYDQLESLGRVRLVFEIPTRSLLGTRSRFLSLTRGEGLLSSELIGYTPVRGDSFQRTTGAMVADRRGVVTEYALRNLEDRGVFFVQPGTQVYEGMIVGENNKETDLNVNVCREKKLSNVRATHGTALEHLHGIREMSLEDAMEWIESDEYIEVTPKMIRIRKKVLAANQRGVHKEGV
ncbi:MAG: translational GTPase TypA [Bradymonadales bacterium]|nr:MAG: translational GTPase TypA [Bradymonadales bacterium]